MLVVELTPLFSLQLWRTLTKIGPSQGSFLGFSLIGCRCSQSGCLLERYLQYVPHFESFILLFPVSRSDDLLSQIEMILRKMPCWGTTPTGLASFLFPRSSTRRTTSYASGQTRRSSNIVKAMDGWYVILPLQSPFFRSRANTSNYRKTVLELQN